MISRQVLDNGKVTSVTKCKHFGFVQRKQNVSAMERGQQTNCQRTNLKPNPVEFAPGHSKCLALVRFGPNVMVYCTFSKIQPVVYNQCCVLIG